MGHPPSSGCDQRNAAVKPVEFTRIGAETFYGSIHDFTIRVYDF